MKHQSLCSARFRALSLAGPSGSTQPQHRGQVREILADAVKPEKRVQLGDALAALGRKIGLRNEDFAVFDQVRDNIPAEPPRFE